MSAVEMSEAYQHLATKADVAELRVEIESLRADMYERLGSLETRLMRWMLGTSLTFITIFVAVAGVLIALLNSAL
ncbi:MAG: hypothetical protein OXF22_06075 [Anaerolineaceae bacterium]|nr:hypothetical protein [Anaerolineaceae bacterium]